ncbi:MAG: PQ-loop repeat-containing protein [Bacteroidaceae bacterium]|nr:PQ-loop repeat-containing protein [Bacteroidaceae bacterium]
MEHQTLFDIIGWIASICMILGYLPQAIQTIRTRQTDGIALPTFLMMGIGAICFMIQGLMLGREGIFLFATNLITATCSVIIFCIKIKNDYFTKR